MIMAKKIESESLINLINDYVIAKNLGDNNIANGRLSDFLGWSIREDKIIA